MTTYKLDYQRATECTGGATLGTLALLEYLTDRWPGSWSKGIYNCRTVRGSTAFSIHAEGRALDLGVDEGTDEGFVVGEQVAAWLVKHAEQIGCQYFIWNRQSWRKSRGWRPYHGTSPHRDHLHIELTREAADEITVDYLEGLDEPPRGTDTREGIQVGPWRIGGNVISYAMRGGDNPACFLLTDEGAVFAFPPSEYRGAPNNEIQGREFDIIGEPDSIFLDDSGYSYVISTDLDRAYGYGP
jgi:hypothetical protein